MSAECEAPFPYARSSCCVGDGGVRRSGADALRLPHNPRQRQR